MATIESNEGFSEGMLHEIDSIVENIGSDKMFLIPILQATQKKFGYLPDEVLLKISELTGIRLADVAGVASFYPRFRRVPSGKHSIKVCIGTACHVKGAETVFDAFRKYLRIPEGHDTDPDGLFTVEKVACLGCCMLAPAVQIDQTTYGYLDAKTIPSVLNDFLASQAESLMDSKVDRGSEGGTEARICTCSSCTAAGAIKVKDELVKRISEIGITCRVKSVSCTGISYKTPFLELVLEDGRSFMYGKVRPGNIKGILASLFPPRGLGGRLTLAAKNLLEKILTGESPEPVTRYCVDVRDGPDSLYIGRQKRIVTDRAGEMEPCDIRKYVETGGFTVTESMVRSMKPEELIGIVSRSGLRGRGGGGFLTGEKFTSVRKSQNPCKYLICNGDEGDPGAFMDRMILESFPFRVIEGMMIAAYATGSRRGFLYVRDEYPLAVHRVKEAVETCRKHGYLGESIFGVGDKFDVEVIRGAGAFVCGEETALIAAIEGGRGMPSYRPPYPSDKGLWGCPTLVNNVETLATLPWILHNGDECFSRIGSEGGRGTKTFALAGKILRGGLIEVPMGMPLREIIEDIGGGALPPSKIKAVQVGGPSGGCIPVTLFDLPVDYGALTGAGAMMGSGGMVVLDESDCMVDIARYFLAFTQNESCGKCTFCRIGTKRMLEILERFCVGQAANKDLDELEHLAATVKIGSLCGLGKTAPNPVLSTLKYFKDEYVAHMSGRCPALRCRKLIRYATSDNCIGCGLCARNCCSYAISGNYFEKHVIDPEKCVRCGVCIKVCRSDAIEIKSP